MSSFDRPEGRRASIPGISALACCISSDCRRNRGDAGAIDEALARLRAELMKALQSWPLEKRATFFVVATVDRDGRRTLDPMEVSAEERHRAVVAHSGEPPERLSILDGLTGAARIDAAHDAALDCGDPSCLWCNPRAVPS